MVAIRSVKACLVFLVAGVVFLVVQSLCEDSSPPPLRPGVACASARQAKKEEPVKERKEKGDKVPKPESNPPPTPSAKEEDKSFQKPFHGMNHGISPTLTSSLVGKELESRWKTPDWKDFYTSRRSALEEAMMDELDSAGNRDPAWREIGKKEGGGCPLPAGTY